MVHIPLSQQWAVQTELLYSEQGAAYNTTYDESDVSGVHNEWDVDYLSIPVLVQYPVYKGLRLETGAQVGFLLKAQTKEYQSNYEQDIEHMLKGVDYAWVVGTGYQTTMGVGIGVRYTVGITNLNESVFIPSTTLKNRVLQVSLVYQFGKNQ